MTRSSRNSVSGSEILVYQATDGEVRVDVRLDRETVWLSLSQLAELFGRDKSVIFRHLRTYSGAKSWTGGQLLQQTQQLRQTVTPRCESVCEAHAASSTRSA